MEAINKLKVADLKKLLKEKKLSTEGSKAILVKRLLASGEKNQSDSDTTQENLDTDEDLILGNDDNCDVEMQKSGAATSARAVDLSTASATAAEALDSSAVLAKSPNSPKKILFPSEPQKSAAVNQKMEERIKRFGVVSEVVKKKSRAERFQVTSPAFHQAVSGNHSSDTEVVAASVPEPYEDVLRKRADRFGTAISTFPLKEEDTGILLKRKARFATLCNNGGMEAKKQKRAERFGLSSY